MEAMNTEAFNQKTILIESKGKSVNFRATASCPFEVEKGNRAHCFFCQAPPVIDPAQQGALIAPSAHLVADGLRVWMHHPEGLGRSRLGEKIGKVITAAQLTGRNLNTVARLAEMLDETAAA